MSFVAAALSIMFDIINSAKCVGYFCGSFHFLNPEFSFG